MVRQEIEFSEHLRETPAGAEGWLQSHLEFILFACVALGFVIRAIIANKNYFNPDEAFFYLFAHQPSLAIAYKANLFSPHPPFLFSLLYFWRFLGDSEFMLRLPSVLAGTLFPWAVFKWLGEVLGRRAGLFALVLLEFSPAMIVLSAEVRGYALLLLFMACALYFLDRAFRENSPLMMWAFFVFLYLAILTEYAALWFTLAVGIYALLRICSRQLAKKVIWVWALSQLGALAIYAFFYITQISKLQGGPLEHQVMYEWLHSSYFQPGTDHLSPFILRGTEGVFQYIFSQNEIAITVFILFLLGVGFLLLKNNRPIEKASRSRAFAALLLLPFAAGSAAGIARLYPYGGSRHDAYLALFAVAGASVLPGLLPEKKLWLGLLAAFSVVAIANLHPKPVEFIQPQDQARFLMEKALKDIHQSISSEAPILVDAETNLVLRYYLCRKQIFSAYGVVGNDSHESECGGYRLIAASPSLWGFTTENFPVAVDTFANSLGLKPGAVAWVAHTGWGADLWPQLAAQFPRLNELPHQDFGANICLFQVRIGEVRHAAGAAH